MKAQRAGRLITVSSVAGRRPEPTGGYAHYGAAKAAIIMYTKYLAQEVGPYGITANCVAPGLIRTGRVAPLLDSMGQHRLEAVALRRYGTPEDCAGVCDRSGRLCDWRYDCRRWRRSLSGAEPIFRLPLHGTTIGRNDMTPTFTRRCAALLACTALGLASPAVAQDKTIKIGVLTHMASLSADAAGPKPVAAGTIA